MTEINDPYPGKDKDPESVRDYGRPNSKPTGKPVARMLCDGELTRDAPVCPNCGCENLCEVTVTVEQKLIRGGVGVGRYLGCPACPWASPMAIVSALVVKKPEGGE